MLKVKYTKLAIEDLDNGYDYIYAENPVAARSVIARIENTINQLLIQPHMGHIGRVEDTYECFVLNTPYIIVYMVENNCLIVVSILHTSRKYP